VREAVSLAIDRTRLVASLPGSGAPATQPVPRFIFGFDPEMPEARADPAAARDLLATAGLGKGFDVVLHSRRIFTDAALSVKEQLADIGVRAEVRSLADPDFFDLLRDKGLTFWLSRYGCNTGDAAQFLETIVHSRDPARHFGVQNDGGYSNHDLDRAIESLAEIEKLDLRRLAIQKLMRRVATELEVIPLYNDEDVYAFDRSLAWRPRNDSYIRVGDIRWR
jgi:ABC-type transport system substrate-binding protein